MNGRSWNSQFRGAVGRKESLRDRELRIEAYLFPDRLRVSCVALCCTMAQRVFFLASEHCCPASALAEETSGAQGPGLFCRARIPGARCSLYSFPPPSRLPVPFAQPTHYNSGTFRDARGMNTMLYAYSEPQHLQSIIMRGPRADAFLFK